jgi:MFS family permease
LAYQFESQAPDLEHYPNLLVGLSLGLYWTAADTAIMDVTTPEDRHNGFAVSVVAESLGVGAGILGGGVLLNRMGNVPMLFAISSLIFLVLLGLILTAIVETRQNHVQSDETTSGWLIALKDRRLLIFIAVNSLFVTYLALVNETMPLYFTNFLSLHGSDTTAGISASPVNIASLFTLCYVGLGAILQVPIASALGSWGWARPLMLSMGLWGLGFLLVWGMGGLASVPLPYEMGALGLLGIATVIYRPFASTFLAEIAPETLRGVYTAMSYQCWAIGYFIGPLLGGWALDQSPTVAHHAWIIVALSTICGLIMLWMLARQNVSKQGESAC